MPTFHIARDSETKQWQVIKQVSISYDKVSPRSKKYNIRENTWENSPVYSNPFFDRVDTIKTETIEEAKLECQKRNSL
jgi:hypothetical protein